MEQGLDPSRAGDLVEPRDDGLEESSEAIEPLPALCERVTGGIARTAHRRFTPIRIGPFSQGYCPCHPRACPHCSKHHASGSSVAQELVDRGVRVDGAVGDARHRAIDAVLTDTVA